MLHNGFRITDYMPTATLVLLFVDPDQPDEKRWAACLALGTKDEPIAFKVLLEALESDDWQIRRFALESIKRHRRAREAEQAIVKMLFDVDPVVQQTACKVCGELGFTAAHDGILQLLASDDPHVRDVAINALAQMWDPDDFAPVFALYQKDDRRAVRVAAAKVLRKQATRHTWRTLYRAWIEDREVRHRMWACELAAKFGDRSLLPELESMTNDRNRNVRIAASESVTRLRAA